MKCASGSLMAWAKVKSRSKVTTVLPRDPESCQLPSGCAMAPWYVSADDERLDADASPICFMSQDSDIVVRSIGSCDFSDEATAYLIAGAPFLFQACQMAMVAGELTDEFRAMMEAGLEEALDFWPQ